MGRMAPGVGDKSFIGMTIVCFYVNGGQITALKFVRGCETCLPLWATRFLMLYIQKEIKKKYQ